jgi:hypothetical protein
LTPRVKQYFAIYSSNDLELPTDSHGSFQPKISRNKKSMDLKLPNL